MEVILWKMQHLPKDVSNSTHALSNSFSKISNHRNPTPVVAIFHNKKLLTSKRQIDVSLTFATSSLTVDDSLKNGDFLASHDFYI